MKSIYRLVIVGLLACSVGACGGDEAPPGGDAGDADAGGADGGRADAGADAGDATDAGGPLDAGGTDAGPVTPGSVAWSEDLENPYVLTLDSEIALDYFLQYTVVVPDPNVPTTWRRSTICQQPAGTATPACVEDEIPAEDGTFGVRFGLDPTNYAEGENRYTFTVALLQDETVIAEAELVWMITYAPM